MKSQLVKPVIRTGCCPGKRRKAKRGGGVEESQLLVCYRPETDIKSRRGRTGTGPGQGSEKERLPMTRRVSQCMDLGSGTTRREQRGPDGGAVQDPGGIKEK